jgi:hypothetical protein
MISPTPLGVLLREYDVLTTTIYRYRATLAFRRSTINASSAIDF